MNLASGTPVQHALYSVFKRAGVPAGVKMINEVFRNKSMAGRIKDLRDGGAVDARARVSYYYAFGVLPDVQKEMELYYERLSLSPFTVGEGIEREDLRLEPGLILQGPINI
jgi:hypothetical protein